MIFQTRDCCSLSPGGVQVPETRGPSSLPVFVASGVAPGTVETARQIVLILLYVLQISIINDMELMGVVRRTSTGCAHLRKRGYPTQVLRVGAADFVGGWANLGCCLITDQAQAPAGPKSHWVLQPQCERKRLFPFTTRHMSPSLATSLSL